MRDGIPSPAALLWRHRRLLLCIVLLNVVLAWMSSLAIRAVLRPILDHSFEAARLVTGFDLTTALMLQQRPEAPMRGATPGALMAAVVYLALMIALDGGIVAVYLEDRRMSLSEFGAYCGQYFWRMARMALYSIVPFGLLAAAQSAISNYANKLSREAPQEREGFIIKVAATLLILLLALLVRLWFDLAQARLVHADRPAVIRELLRSFPAAFRSGVYWQYLGIALFAIASFAAGITVWTFLPHEAIVASFVVLELLSIAQIAARLWMKAASARWVALQVEPPTYLAMSTQPITPDVDVNQAQPE